MLLKLLLSAGGIYGAYITMSIITEGMYQLLNYLGIIININPSTLIFLHHNSSSPQLLYGLDHFYAASQATLFH